MKLENLMLLGFLFLIFGIGLRFYNNFDLVLIFDGVVIMTSVIATSLIRISNSLKQQENNN